MGLTTQIKQSVKQQWRNFLYFVFGIEQVDAEEKEMTK